MLTGRAVSRRPRRGGGGTAQVARVDGGRPGSPVGPAGATKVTHADVAGVCWRQGRPRRRRWRVLLAHVTGGNPERHLEVSEKEMRLLRLRS